MRLTQHRQVVETLRTMNSSGIVNRLQRLILAFEAMTDGRGYITQAGIPMDMPKPVLKRVRAVLRDAEVEE